MNPGIHLLHKPEGLTSFSLVQASLKSAEPRSGKKRPKICHGGTLDPFATGLLLILVEPATKLFDYLHAVPKVYEATVRWGIETDTGDFQGQPVFQADPANLSAQQLEDMLPQLIGWHDQIPHPTSAKRIDGERAYLKAHRGETVIMPASRVYLHAARWLDHDLPRQSRLELTARGGYYVRALARDLGKLAACGAHLTALHRTSIGPWTDPGLDQTVEIHARDILPWSATRILSDQEVGDLRQDRPIPRGDLLAPDWPLPPDFPDPQSPIRGFHRDKFCFLLRPQDEQLQLITPLRGGL